MAGLNIQKDDDLDTIWKDSSTAKREVASRAAQIKSGKAPTFEDIFGQAPQEFKPPKAEDIFSQKPLSFDAPKVDDATLASDTGNLAGAGSVSAVQGLRSIAIEGLKNAIRSRLDPLGTNKDVSRVVGLGVDVAAKSDEANATLDSAKKSYADDLSQAMAVARERKWINTDDGGISLGDAWKDPRSYYSGIVESIPGTILGMTPSMFTAKAVYESALKKNIEAGLTREAAELAASKTAAKAALYTGAATEGAMSGGQSYENVRADVMKLPDSVLAQSDAYNELRAQGLSKEGALRALAEDAGSRALVLAGVTSAAFGGRGDAMLAKIFTGGAKDGLLKRVGKGAIAEGLLEEFPQSATQRLSENIAIQGADPTRNLMDDVLNQGVAGAVAGGIMGGGMASPGRIMGGKRDEPEKKPGLDIPSLDNVEDIPAGPKYDGGIDFDKTPPTNDQSTPSADELAARVAELEAETRKRQEAEMRQAQRDSEVEQFLKKDGEEPAKPVIDKLAERVQEKIEQTTAKQAKELVESRTVEPKKTTQQIIEEQTGVARTKEPTIVAAKRVTDAANEVVGVKQGEGQIEKPLTAAEDKARRVEGDASPRPISSFVAGDQVIVRDKTIPKFDGKIATIVERKNKKGKVVGLQAMVNGKPVGNPASLFEKAVAAAPTTPNATGTTAVAPTLAQMTAGNYKKAPVRIAGMEAKVETPSGVERVDKETGGKKWRARMPEGVDYGYFRRTKGADGDAIDGFFGTDTASDTVWVIDQKNEDGSFDEHKAMAQFPDEKSARAAYVGSFSDGKGDSRIQAITPMSVTEFRKWAKSLDGKKQPAAEYVAQKQAPQQQEQTNEQETTTNDVQRREVDGERVRQATEPTVDEKDGQRDARVSDRQPIDEVSDERASQPEGEDGQEPVAPTNILAVTKARDARIRAAAEKNSLPPPTKADAKSAADEFTPEQEALAQEEWDEQYEPPADLMGKVEEAIPYDELPPAIQDEWLIAVSNGKATQKKYDTLHRRAKVEMAKEARRQRQEGRVKLEDEDFLVRDAAAMLDGDMPGSDEAFSDKAVENLVSKVRAMKGKENWTATRVTPTVGKRLLAGAIGRLFGHNIVFVESNEPFFGGVVIDNTNLFVSNNWPVSTSAIMGHELTHLLKRNAPELYKSLEGAVLDIVPQTMLNQYEVDLGRDRAKSGIGSALPLAKVREELVADFVGDRFTEPEFWRAMAKGTGDNFAAIVYNAMAVVKRVQRLFDAAKPDLKSAAYASTQAEVNALRDVIAKTALDYAREIRQERGDSDFVSFLITAFHGTGVQGIKRLSTDYVNKGTGAQEQGWGLYLAASMNLAKRYTNSLSVWEYVLDGKPVDGSDLGSLEKLLGDERKAKMAAYFLKNGGDYKPVAVVPGTERLFNAATSELAHIKATIAAIEDTPYGGFMEDEIAADEKEMMDEENARELKRLKERFEVMTKLAEVGRPKGALYKIDINADPADLLSLSEPYSAQSPKVKKAIRKLLGVTPTQDSTGDVLYKRIASEVFDGDKKAASLALRDEGVYGARYAWVDHATGAPTENYVIYDDKLLSDAETVNYSVRGSVETLSDGATEQPNESADTNFSVRGGNDPAGEIKVVPNKYRKPVEVYALRGDTIVGMATFDQDNKRWTIHISKTGEDLRTNGDINTFTVDGQPEKVIPRLREMTKADRMVRRKSTPEMPEEMRGPSDLVEVDTAYRASSGRFIDGIKAVLNIGDDEKRRAFELQRNYQDRYIYVKILQDALEKGGVKLDSRINLYRSISLYTNRAGNALEKFGERFVEPIEEQLKAVVAAGGTVKDVDDYLLARHAKERNDHIKAIDPTNEKGSGITTAEADGKLKELAAKSYSKHLEEIGRITDTISEFKVGMMLNSGLIDQNTANNLMKYKHYVTLKNDEDDSGMLLGGFRGGFSGGGDPAKRALGRKTEANHVLAHTLLDAESKIMRAYKNEVNRTLLALVEAAPDPNLWVAEPMKSQRVYDEKTGTIKFVADPQALMAPNMFSAYINGEKYRIELKDPDLVQALTTDSGNDGAFINGMRAMNRYFSTMITTLNPEWFLTNAVRDMQSTALNLKADKDLPEDITQRVTSEIVRLSKQKEMYSFLRGGKETEFTRDYQRLEQLGGITKFYGFKTLEDKAASIREMEDRALNRGVKAKAVNALEKSKGLDIIRWFEDVNLAVEAVPRVATFRALVKAGWDEKRAAEYAQNITVNFSRRGAADTHLSKFVTSGYLFFNPAVQGTVRLAQAMASPTGKKIAATLFGLGLLAAFIGHAGGDDDENEVNDYEQLTDAERAKNICIFGAKIPLPLGWNAFYAAGNFLGDAVWGKKTMAQATMKSAKAMIDAFNPFGGSNSNDPYKLALKTATPTVFDPLVELALNENNFGSPIRKQATNGVQTKPDSQMYFPSVSAPSRWLTKTLNELTGGTAAIPGAIDINPETLDYLAKTYLPGPGATALRLTNVATKSANDQKVEAREIPFARNFVASPSKGFQLEMMRDIKTEVGELARAQKERSPMDVEKLKQYPGWAGVKAAVDSADSQIRALSTRRAEILDGKRKVPNEGQELDRISEQIKSIENRVIRRYMETKEKNRWPD